MIPQNIRAAEKNLSPQTLELQRKAHAAQTDASLSDAEADLIISECNAALVAEGMLKGGLLINRSEYRKAWPGILPQASEAGKAVA